jgi:hypothetical protein
MQAGFAEQGGKVDRTAVVQPACNATMQKAVVEML